MLLGNCLRKCCWIVPNSMFLSCFLYKFSWFPPSHTVMVTGRFGPAGGILTWIVSAWVVKRPFLHFSLFFPQNLTPAHLSIHTHSNEYIITFRLWPKQPKTEMTHSENWPKWPTYQVRNDPPPKCGPTSFFHSFEIGIIECEHNRILCLFLEFWWLFYFNLYFRCHFVWIFAKLCLLVL